MRMTLEVLSIPSSKPRLLFCLSLLVVSYNRLLEFVEWFCRLRVNVIDLRIELLVTQARFHNPLEIFSIRGVRSEL